jgi:5'-phosphate synthase pdxT subunit
VRIGVVAIQGDFERHQLILEKLQIEHIPVRNVDQLKQCDALIIPGGESTTILKLLKASKLSHSIKKFAQKKAIMGTCAGLIVLANKVHNPPMESLQLLDVEVTRNAYGRQIESIGFHGKEVVMVENSHILAATFHPELTNDTSIHEHFANKVKKLLS